MKRYGETLLFVSQEKSCQANARRSFYDTKIKLRTAADRKMSYKNKKTWNNTVKEVNQTGGLLWQ